MDGPYLKSSFQGSTRFERFQANKAGRMTVDKKIVYTLSIGKPNHQLVVTPGIPHLLIIKRGAVSIDVIEAEDTLFRFKSAVFLPDGLVEEDEKDKGQATSSQLKVEGLAVLSGIFQYLNLCSMRGEEKRLLITGHTDTVGSDNYNAKLSLLRAEVILSLMEGGLDARKKFVEHVSKNNTPEDQQQILQWIAKRLSPFDNKDLNGTEDDPKKWNHDPNPKWKDVDPGDVDGKIGDLTNTAIRNFKTVFKKRFPPESGYPGVSYSPDLQDVQDALGKDATFDKNVWAAIFEIYQAELQSKLLQNGLDIAELRATIKWVDETKKAVGCGETWPIDSRGTDNYRSQSNRRVEILFYDPYELKKYTPGKDIGDEEKNFLPCKDGKCAKGDCHIFRDIEREKTDDKTLEPKLVWKYIKIAKDGNLIKDAPLGHVWLYLYSPLYHPLSKITCRLNCDGNGFPEQELSTDGEVYWDNVPLSPCSVELELGAECLILGVPWLREKKTAHEVLVMDCKKLLGTEESTYGIQARLLGLGYECGKLDGIIGPLTRKAISNFQHDQMIEETGTADPITQEVLVSLFGA
jgi:hypothetical protein